MTAVYDEPLLPPPGEPATSRDEYRITYRDPETGEEFTLLSDRATWLEKRNGLRKMGYPVVVQKRQIHTTAWEQVGDK
ncbi:hypothetical protein [Nocardia xishanensis]|uniref:hypothetical protein n=1 Tax=Nocardia xishanensis TaxID=238964 RepID=UPI000836843B|nr:hypothetical protein [Nocardia xishanensis]